MVQSRGKEPSENGFVQKVMFQKLPSILPTALVKMSNRRGADQRAVGHHGERDDHVDVAEPLDALFEAEVHGDAGQQGAHEQDRYLKPERGRDAEHPRQRGLHRGQGDAHGHGGTEQQAEDEEHVHAAPEEAVLLFADDHVGGGADAQEGLAADVEHVGDGQGGDEIGAPRVRPPVQQQVGEGPVIGLRAHGRCVLRWLHDVPQGLDDRPEHDRPGHPGTEDHGYP